MKLRRRSFWRRVVIDSWRAPFHAVPAAADKYMSAQQTIRAGDTWTHAPQRNIATSPRVAPARTCFQYCQISGPSFQEAAALRIAIGSTAFGRSRLRCTRPTCDDGPSPGRAWLIMQPMINARCVPPRPKGKCRMADHVTTGQTFGTP